MKHIQHLLLVSILLLTGCESNHDIPIPDSSQSSPHNNLTNLRSEAEILDAACRAATFIESTPSSRAHGKISRKINLDNGIITLQSKKSRSTGSNEYPIYVVNYQDNMGCALISSNKDAEAVLAVTVQGNITSLDDIQNPGLLMFIDAAQNYVDKPDNYPILKKPNDKYIYTLYTERFYEVDTLWAANIEPRTPNLWGQYHPEGERCPNGVAGCANTALALALSFYEYPRLLTLTYPEEAGTVINLNWSNIKKHNRFTLKPMTCTGCSEDDTQLAHKQLAQLCRELGERNKSTYYANETGTTTKNLRKTMEDLGFEIVTRDYKFGNARDALKYSPVLLMEGREGDSGHMWICDGVKSYSFRKRLCETDPNGLTDEVKILSDWEYYDGRTYNFYNWGWGDNAKIPNIDSNTGEIYNVTYLSGWFLDGVFTTTDNVYHGDTTGRQHTYTEIKYSTVLKQ